MSVKRKLLYLTGILILFLLAFYQKTYGQSYNFSNYTVESGLAQPQILSIYQDREGVMWFGSNEGGITKYNGRSFDYVTQKDGLPDNLIYAMVEDNKGRVLIGTNNGLSVYDGKKFRNYTTAQGLSHDRIFTIFFDSKGNTLLGTGKGISILKDSICSVYNINESLNNAAVFSIMEDSKHNIWYSTIGNGVFKENNNLVKNYKTGSGLKTDYVYSTVEKESGEIWFLTDEGIFESTAGHIEKLNIPAVLKDLTYYSHLKDEFNNIWLASSAGLVKYDGKQFRLFTQKNGLVNNNIWKIFQDRESNLWFTSRENGISKLTSERFYMFTTEDGLLFSTTDRIYQSKDSRYWIGSRQGLSVYNGKTFLNYNRKNWKINNEVTAITEDAQGRMYIGTSYGLLKYDGKSFVRIEAAEDKRGLNYIHDIYIDDNKEIWLGTKLGVAKVQNGKIEEFEISGAPQNFIYKIHKDSKGIYWLGGVGGIFKYDGTNIYHVTEKDGFGAKTVVNIIEDKNGSIWFATNLGVYRYFNGNYTVITEKDGLSSNIVQSLSIDKLGTIWVGLLNGVDKIQANSDGKYTIDHYGIDDGFLGGACMQNAILIDNHNKIWFGAEKGLMVYQPEYDKTNELEPITRIKNVQLFGQPKTDWKLFTDSVDQNNLPINLQLEHHRNYLTFNFIGVSLTAPGKVRYKWMLKGLNKDWLPESPKTEAVYSNLPPGKYEFMVIASNGDGVWNKEPVTFKFIILPPFWQTWWFYSIIATIVLSGIYSYVKIRASNIQIVKQSHIIEEKNEEIKKAYSEIAGKNKNITDSINYAQRIQQSFLTSDNILKQSLKDYFILYKPRDIVSGDFYWCFDLPDRTLIAGADSTGHGIPGAFMSLIGISLLNEISHSKKMLEPAAMLDELRRIIICALNPEQIDEGGKDGLDIALISIFKSETDEVKIHFSGGNNGLYLIASSEYNQKELLEYKGDKQPVGYYSNMKPFTQKEIIARKGDVLYMFTDGYADQFGGRKGKKFMSKQLKKTLVFISERSLQEQKQELDNTFTRWKGDLEQVDDLTVIGIRIS